MTNPTSSNEEGYPYDNLSELLRQAGKHTLLFGTPAVIAIVALLAIVPEEHYGGMIVVLGVGFMLIVIAFALLLALNHRRETKRAEESACE